MSIDQSKMQPAELTEEESAFVQKQWQLYTALMGAMDQMLFDSFVRLKMEIDNHTHENQDMFYSILRRSLTNDIDKATLDAAYRGTDKDLN